MQALIAAGYQVYAINPLQVARYRERHSVSGAKSDTGDAHVLADMVRTDRHQLRPVAGDSAEAEAVKVVTRAHKTLIWERTRHLLRLRHALREFFPAALVAFDDLTAAGCAGAARRGTRPGLGGRAERRQITAALKRARRRDRRREGRGDPGRAARRAAWPAGRGDRRLRGHRARPGRDPEHPQHRRSKHMEEQVEAHFGQHPDAEIYLSQPGLGVVLGARVLAEFGDDKNRYADARARKNYAGTSPITRQSGKKKLVLARYVHNDRLIDALGRQAFAALRASPGARAYYDQLRARGIGHHAALRQLGNRLVGILHGCLKTAPLYDEATAWAHHQQDQQAAA